MVFLEMIVCANILYLQFGEYLFLIMPMAKNNTCHQKGFSGYLEVGTLGPEDQPVYFYF
jgi:hypothetical protein